MADHVQKRRVDEGLRGLSMSIAGAVVARKVGPPWIVSVPGYFLDDSVQAAVQWLGARAEIKCCSPRTKRPVK